MTTSDDGRVCDAMGENPCRCLPADADELDRLFTCECRFADGQPTCDQCGAAIISVAEWERRAELGP